MCYTYVKAIQQTYYWTLSSIEKWMGQKKLSFYITFTDQVQPSNPFFTGKPVKGS